MAAALSRQLRRPIRWMSTRHDDLVSTLQVDALASLGIRHVDMPLTPEKIWRLVRASGG